MPVAYYISYINIKTEAKQMNTLIKTWDIKTLLGYIKTLNETKAAMLRENMDAAKMDAQVAILTNELALRGVR